MRLAAPARYRQLGDILAILPSVISAPECVRVFLAEIKFGRWTDGFHQTLMKMWISSTGEDGAERREEPQNLQKQKKKTKKKTCWQASVVEGGTAVWPAQRQAAL